MESQIYSPMMTTVPTTTVKTNRVCGVILMMLKVTCVLVLMGLMSFYIYGQVVVVPPPTSSNASNASTIAIPARFQIMIQKLVDEKLEKITGHHRHASTPPSTTSTTTTTTHSTTPTTPTTTTTTVNATSDYDYDAVHRLPDTLANASGDDYDANTLLDGA
jgi:hypothetical protein